MTCVRMSASRLGAIAITYSVGLPHFEDGRYSALVSLVNASRHVYFIATSNKCIATSNKCIATSNKCIATSNKKLPDLFSFSLFPCFL